MRILGLDPSLRNYGWALHETREEGSARCECRGRFRTKPKQFADELSRYLYLRSCLQDLVKTQVPDAVGIEHPVFNEDYSEGMYGLFLFSMEALKNASQDVVLFAPPQVKVFARERLGRPRSWKMQKADMVEAAKVDAGGKGRWDHNEADAYHVACFAGRFWEFYRGELQLADLSEYEIQTFTMIRKITRGKRAGRTVKHGILHRESERFFVWSRGSTDAGQKDE